MKCFKTPLQTTSNNEQYELNDQLYLIFTILYDIHITFKNIFFNNCV
jgi:hypothetical protein